MAVAVLMPQVGISVESCIVTQWLKKKGDKVLIGDVLFTYETDKSSLECESTEEGELLEIFFGDGEEVPVLTAVCVIGTAGENIDALRPSGALQGEPVETEHAQVEPEKVESQPAVTTSEKPSGKVSPRARRLAEKNSINTGLAAATGPYGRVIERDIRKMITDGVGIMAPSAYATSVGMNAGSGIGVRVGIDDIVVPRATGLYTNESDQYQDIAFSGIRKAISKSMTKSVTEIPQLTHNFSFDASEIMDYRKKIKAAGESLNLPNITLNDFIVFAVSRIILKYPELNAHMLDAYTIRQFSDVNIGLAVDTPRGLMVPVISRANEKSLAEISAEVKEIAAAAVDGTISPDKLSGATFTISNLGTVGVESFSPIINPPQTGVLGVCNITQRVKEINGEVLVYPAMGISLTYDHRAIDGAPASRFAYELCGHLEKFTTLLAV